MVHLEEADLTGGLDPTFALDLVDWYDRVGRELPWRKDREPYKVWLSEVMLQQTQVETVIPYYKRWLRKYPTPGHVAEATEEAILKMWEGLGYYRRARLFREACMVIAERYDGMVPADADVLRSLPGVGAYTWAAIRSICFDDPVPAVDGNIRRVLSRIKRLDATGNTLTRAAANALGPVLKTLSPGKLNQALMDLGAMICRSRNPACESCPVQQHCEAYRDGMVAAYPLKVTRKKVPHVMIAVGIVWHNGKVLIAKRPADGLLGGLWEFPGGKIEQGETAAEATVREIEEEIGIEVEIESEIGAIKHAYTHFTINMTAFKCRYVSGEARPIGCTEIRWLPLASLKKLPFPKANHKLFPLIGVPLSN